MPNLDDIKSRHVKQTEQDRGMQISPDFNAYSIANAANQYNTGVREKSSGFNMSGSLGGLNVGQMFPTDSQYDRNITESQLLNSGRSLEDLRAERQPWYDQWANNLANMGVIATTTFVDSFIGTAAGLINMVFNPHDDGESNLSWGERQAKNFIKNPVSLWLNSINKWTKENLPTYNTDEYNTNQAEGKWWKNLGTSQFWGETFVENSGFTLGMVGSGKVTGSFLNKIAKIGEQTNIIKSGINDAIKAGKLEGNADDIFKKVLSNKQSLKELDLTGELAKAVKNINQSRFISRGITTGISVIGEARQEGINSSLEYEEQQFNNLESPEGQLELITKTAYEMFSNPEYDYIFKSDIFQGDILENIKPEYLEVFQAQVDKNKKAAEVEIKDASARVAVMDFTLNFPILYASTLWQFGRTFSKGFDTQRNILNNAKAAIKQPVNSLELEGSKRISKEGGRYIVNNSILNKIKKGAMVASNPLAEANEEMLQAAAQTASEKWAGSKMNSFLGYKLDPEAEQEKIGKLNTIWNGIIDTYSDLAKYQEGFSGLIMGGMGSLNFTFTRNNQGRIPLFEGGVWQDRRDIKQENQDLQAAADALNNRLASPEFKNYYQGLIRHNSLEENKGEALQSGDKFSFLNNDHAQLISDIMTFEKAGKLQDLYDNIDVNIENFSTTNPTQIADIASEIRESGKNTETGEDIFKNKTDEELVKESLEWNQSLKSSIDNYRTILNNLNSLIGSQFQNDDEFNEMVYLYSQIDNFENRYEDLHQNIINKLNNLKSRGLNFKKFTINLQGLEKSLTLAEIISQATPDELKAFIYGRQDEFGNFYKGDDYINGLLINDILKKKGLIKKNRLDVKAEEFESMLKSITPDAYEITQDFIDLVKIEDARSKLVNTYNKFIGQPYLLREKLDKEEETASNAQEDIINTDIKSNIKNVSSIEELRNLVKEEREKGTNIDRILSEMSISDNKDYSPLVSEYRQIENLKDEINDTYTAKNTTSGNMEGVNQLFNILKNKAESLDELINPVITDDILSSLGDRNNPYTQDDRQQIKDTLLSALKEIKDNEDRYNNLKKDLKVAGKDINTNTSTNPISTKPVGNITTKQATTENKVVKTNLDQKNIPTASTNKVWNNGIFEIDIDVYNATGQIQMQSNPIFKPAVEFLKAQGAFDYVNSGKLNRNQKVHFMASEIYWDELVKNGADSEWVDKNHPLLLVVEDSTEGSFNHNGNRYQVVGTFTNNLNPALHTKILSEYNKGGQLYISEESTSIINITPGRLEFNEEKLVSSLGNTRDNPIMFGIATDTGQLEHNLGDVGVFNITPTNTDFSNSGRLYLLTKSAVSDEYIPTAVRVKTLNEVDTNKDIPLFNELKKSLKNLADKALSLNDDEIGKSVHDLRNIVYVGSKAGIPIVLRRESNGNRTDYNLVITKGDKTEIVPVGYLELITDPNATDGGWIDNYVMNDAQSIADNLLNSLVSLKTPFQINKNAINGKWNVRTSMDYNNVLLEADILTTNLKNNKVQGAYFVTNPLDNNFKEVKDVNSSIPKKNNDVSKPTIIGSSNDTFGKAIQTSKQGIFTINDRGEVLDNKGLKVNNNSIINEVKVLNYLQSLSQNQLNDIKFDGKDIFPNSMWSLNTYYVMPSGQIWNGTILLPSTSAAAKAIEDFKSKKSKKEESTINQEEVKEELSLFREQAPAPTSEFGEDLGLITEEVNLFGNSEETSPEISSETPKRRESRKPSKGAVSGSLLGKSNNLSKQEIQDKIDENKDYQKDNCNGIIK